MKEIHYNNFKCLRCGKECSWPKSRNTSCQYCSKECANKSKIGKKIWWGYKISAKLKGKHKSKEHIEKVRLKRKGVPLFSVRGDKHWNWKGGENSIKELIRKSPKNKQWKIKCFQRDKVCVFCGEKNNRLLEVDHLVPLSFLIKEFEIKTLEDAERCSVLWDIENGRVLCRKCHKQTDTYGEKANKFSNED